MTSAAAFLLGLAAAFAIANWYAVAVANKALEYVAKPATLAALIGVAVALVPEDGSRRSWFVAALVLSLAGDVFLMLPRDLFVAGLASFLLAHLAYVGGLGAPAPVATGLVVVLSIAIGTPVVRRVERALTAPVVAYMIVITLMLGAAISTEWLAAAGAAAFYASDALIAYNRFVFDAPKRWAAIAIMVLYHLGQAGLTLSLLA